MKKYSEKDLKRLTKITKVIFIILGLMMLMLAIVYPIFLVFAALVFFFAYKYKAKDPSKNKQGNTVSNSTLRSGANNKNGDVPTPNNNDNAKKVYTESEKNYNLFEDVFNGCLLRYDYEENLCIQEDVIDRISGNGGKALSFEKEPNNEYDNKAIAVYLNEVKIGYVYKGHIQDMLNDWISRGDTFIGYINKIFISENKVTYKIGFYKSLELFKHKQFSLVKTSKKIDDDTKREDNLYGCENGDSVTFEYDNDSESYVVYNDSYEEIGELPNSANQFIGEHQCQNLVGIIDEYEFDDNEKLKAKASVYLIKK